MVKPKPKPMKRWPLITTISISKEEESIFFSVFFFFSFHLEDDKLKSKEKQNAGIWNKEFRIFIVSEEQRIKQERNCTSVQEDFENFVSNGKKYLRTRKKVWNNKMFWWKCRCKWKEEEGEKILPVDANLRLCPRVGAIKRAGEPAPTQTHIKRAKVQHTINTKRVRHFFKKFFAINFNEDVLMMSIAWTSTHEQVARQHALLESSQPNQPACSCSCSCQLLLDDELAPRTRPWTRPQQRQPLDVDVLVVLVVIVCFM